METISNVATQAAKAVWGDGSEHKEPVSGQQGDVARGEPYDAGNMDASDQQRIEKTLGGSQDGTDHTHPDTPEDDAPENASTGVMGDGPRPLQTVAREKSGDTGSSADRQASGARTPSAGHGGGNAAQADDEDKGTGEQHVKTTGFAADGGDFDATKPGAGREADRLLEEKGLGNDAPGSSGARRDAAASGAGQHKPSLGERIKNKLHGH